MRWGKGAILRPLSRSGVATTRGTQETLCRLRDTELPLLAKESRAGVSHFHRVHLGGAPALDLAGPEHRAVVHAAAREDPCRGEPHILGACLALCYSLTPTHLSSGTTLIQGPCRWRGQRGRAGEVDLWYRSPAKLLPSSPPEP